MLTITPWNQPNSKTSDGREVVGRWQLMVSKSSKLQDPSQGDRGARTPKCAAAMCVGPIVEWQQGVELTLASNLKCKLWLLEMFSRALIFGKSPARCSSSSQDGRAVQGAAFRSQSPLEAWVRIPLLTWLALSCHSRLKPDTGWDLFVWICMLKRKLSGLCQ